MVSSVNLYGSQGVNYSNLYSKNVNGVTSDDLYSKDLNGVTSDNLYKKGVDLTGILSFNGLDNIMPENKKSVTIDGQTYKVVKVQDNDSLVKTLAPRYKEVVIIDGQQYDVQTVSDRRGCDMTKEVVVVDGKQYDVKNNNKISLLS